MVGDKSLEILTFVELKNSACFRRFLFDEAIKIDQTEEFVLVESKVNNHVIEHTTELLKAQTKELYMFCQSAKEVGAEVETGLIHGQSAVYNFEKNFLHWRQLELFHYDLEGWVDVETRVQPVVVGLDAEE